MENIEINQDVLNRIYFSVRLLEGDNLKTGEYNDRDMVKKIINIIDSETRKGSKNHEV